MTYRLLFSMIYYRNSYDIGGFPTYCMAYSTHSHPAHIANQIWLIPAILCEKQYFPLIHITGVWTETLLIISWVNLDFYIMSWADHFPEFRKIVTDGKKYNNNYIKFVILKSSIHAIWLTMINYTCIYALNPSYQENISFWILLCEDASNEHCQ